MKRSTITIENSLYGDSTYDCWVLDMTVGAFTFEVAAYRMGPSSWTVSLVKNGSYIEKGKTRRDAINAAQARLDNVGEERVRFSVENAK